MRAILFRGKRTDNGEWVYGYVGTAFTIDENGKVKSRHFTALDCLGWSSQVLVSDETIGRFTGLTDKNGVRIFEGDILGGFLDEEYPEHETVTVVEWRECMWVTHQRNCHPDLLEESDMDWFEVIGNIYDNPELMKGGDADANVNDNKTPEN